MGTDKLASSIDYAQQLANDVASAANAGSATYSTNATPVVGLNANFDASYVAYNASTVTQAGSSYTVNDGDSLASIALSVWGDASLWYVIADANGLEADANLVAGQSLILPDKVVNLHNTSQTFKPYNPNDALGDTTPTLPKEPQPPAPKKQGCGIGQIIVAIITIAVTAIVMPYAIQAVAGHTITGTFAAVSAAAAETVAGSGGLAFAVAGGAVAGAAGSIASQSFAVATGIQSKFNWTAVAMGAISGAVGGAFSGSFPGIADKFLQGMARGAATSVVTQGVNMAVGLQKKFDWTSVAVAGVGSGVSAAVGQLGWVQGLGKTGSEIVVGTASLLANAATKSLITGQDFGKSIREALPDAIASTVGNMIGEALKSKIEEQSAKSAAAKSAAQKQRAQEQIDTALNDKGLSAVKFGALDKEALRADHILSGRYTLYVRDDGTSFQDTSPQVKEGDQMVPLVGAEDKGGQLFRFDDGAKAEGRQVTVEWAARDDGSFPVTVVSVDGGQFYEFNQYSRIDDLGLSISNGADTYDFKAAAARYEVRKAEAERYNNAMRHSSDYAAIGNPDAAAWWAYSARAGEPAAYAAHWSGFRKEAYNQFWDTSMLIYNQARLSTGVWGKLAPVLQTPHATIRPEERTGAGTFTATSIAASSVAPEYVFGELAVGSNLTKLSAVDRMVAAETTAVNAGNSGRGVAFFGESNLRYYNVDGATIGAPGRGFFMMPLEDSAVVTDAASAARYTGMSPSTLDAYKSGGDIYGLSFKTEGMAVRTPTAADAMGWPHYLEGGNTAVLTGEGPNAGYLVNPTREFVIPGGNPVPTGSVLFKVGPSGEWIPVRKY